MRVLTENELSNVGGGITAVEGAGLIFAIGAFALASPIVVGVTFGAGGGLLAAHILSLLK